jgi:ABC-type bacteriocin/lantibiotic exporter with double-glycine peptidase domain
MLAAGLLIGFGMFPMSLSYLTEHRTMIRQLRARMIGARYLGEKGVVLQSKGNDCGAASLKMILTAHGIECNISELASDLHLMPQGTSMLNLRLASVKHGVIARSWSIRPDDLRRLPLPAIAFIYGNHFVVIRRLIAPNILEVDDPALGKLQWPTRSFQRYWTGATLIFDSTWAPL